MEYYQHKPLSDSSTEIRLVNLQPGHESDPIDVRLTHAPLDGNFTFDALSYAWGDPKVTHPISIDGLPFRATVNLESALRHLRLELQPRVIWIDAICIHQSNIEERDQQVRRMGSIYTNAKHILVWLGPEADDSNLAMETIGENFCESLVDQELLEHSQSPITGEWESTQRLKALVKLFSRPWWRRGWIIQEISRRGRPRDNVLLHCGHSQKRWEVLDSAIQHHHKGEWLLRRKSKNEQSELNDISWTKLGDEIEPARALTLLNGKLSTGMEIWLRILRKFETTEPKDKFWIACLLSQDDESSLSNIKPEYRWSLIETYIFIVRHLLDTRGSLRVLEHCGAFSDLPSWVPDWRVRGAAPLSGWLKSPFQACGFSKLSFEISGNKHLHLKGFRFDCAERFPPLVNFLSDIPQQSEAIGPTYRATGESSMRALLRVVYADRSRDIQQAFEWILTPKERRRTLKTPSPFKYKQGLDDESDIVHYNFLITSYKTSTATMSGRKFFVSANNFIGLVPEAAQVGDLICIFGGGNTPFLVRPVGENYQLLGACYVHGIMYGEATKEFEEQGLEMQDFVLL